MNEVVARFAALVEADRDRARQILDNLDAFFERIEALLDDPTSCKNPALEGSRLVQDLDILWKWAPGDIGLLDLILDSKYAIGRQIFGLDGKEDRG